MNPFRRQPLDPSHPFRIQEDGAGLGSVRLPSRETAVDDLFSGALGAGPRLGLTVPGKTFRRAGIVVSCALMLLVARSAHLQIIQGTRYDALAEGNRVRVSTIVPPRGIIADRNGKVLAANVSTFVLTMTPSDLPTDASERNKEFDLAAELAGLQRTDLDLLYEQGLRSPDEPEPVRKGMTYEAAMRLAVETIQMPGFRLETATVRAYETAAASLSHILGYVGRVNDGDLKANPGYRGVDDIGKAGIEKSEEAVLRGVAGKSTVEVDARGHELSLVSQQEAVPGANLTLTIDADLQKVAEDSLIKAMKAAGRTRGAVVAMDPRNGAIRALVSLPAYDDNAFAQGIDTATYQKLIDDKDQPLFPRATAGQFPSGSVFKPFIAYAALKENVVTEHTSFLSTGGLSVGPYFFPDWKVGGHGITDIKKALADSVNTYFYIVGGGYGDVTGLGVERITDYARRFGFGAPTGVELPGEAAGFLPSKDWKQKTKGDKWYVGDTYHLSIGQGDLLVTPLQLAAATCVVANDGHRVQPTLVQAVNGVAAKATPPPDVPFDPSDLEIVREGMRQGVTAGSSRRLSTLPIPIAGKTGTAQTPDGVTTHAWWSGFGPYDNPNLVVVVLIEQGGEGSTYAVPVAQDIFTWWAAHGLGT
jgi:penicillin-binding protein 2